MRVIQRSSVNVVDIAGKEHNVVIIQYDDVDGFTARIGACGSARQRQVSR